MSFALRASAWSLGFLMGYNIAACNPRRFAVNVTSKTETETEPQNTRSALH